MEGLGDRSRPLADVRDPIVVSTAADYYFVFLTYFAMTKCRILQISKMCSFQGNSPHTFDEILPLPSPSTTDHTLAY